MANKSVNEHAQDHESGHEHGGSSVGFYIFIALVLGAITYVEFALVEYQDTWFTMLSGTSIFIWLAVLSVVKFVLVVMFFMHLKGDYVAFTGFFTSGMVIAVGTLFALSALFTVRSVAKAQTPQQEGGTEAHGEASTGTHGGVLEIDPEHPLVHSLEYPEPKNQDVSVFDFSTQYGGGGDISSLDSDAQSSGSGENGASATTIDGLPRAPEPGNVTLVDPFSAEGAAVFQPASAGGAEAPASGDPAAGEALFTGALGCTSCHGADGTGGVGPNLTDSEWIYGGDEAALTETLNNGRPGGMPAFSGQASEEDIANVVAYVMSLSSGQ